MSAPITLSPLGIRYFGRNPIHTSIWDGEALHKMVQSPKRLEEFFGRYPASDWELSSEDSEEIEFSSVELGISATFRKAAMPLAGYPSFETPFDRAEEDADIPTVTVPCGHCHSDRTGVPEHRDDCAYTRKVTAYEDYRWQLQQIISRALSNDQAADLAGDAAVDVRALVDALSNAAASAQSYIEHVHQYAGDDYYCRTCGADGRA